MTSEAQGAGTAGDGSNETLDDAILASLDGLLGALDLQALGNDRFTVVSEPGRFDRVFGGQLLAQALIAASATVAGKEPHSLHAYFVEGAEPGATLELAVERVRDGRSFATRRVTVRQGPRELLTAIASFHSNPEGDVLADPPPEIPAPDELPRLQDWAVQSPPDLRPAALTWVERPPPVDVRLGEAPTFFGGPLGSGSRSHWMRLPRDVGDDPGLHAALLTYASDYLLLDMAIRSQPAPVDYGALTAFSLDHSVWLHRPVRFDQWHLHTQETMAISGHRGLVRGAIHDTDGQLVASVVQETLVRPTR